MCKKRCKGKIPLVPLVIHDVDGCNENTDDNKDNDDVVDDDRKTTNQQSSPDGGYKKKNLNWKVAHDTKRI